MKIFIVSHMNPRAGSHELISQLSCIHSERHQAVPIVVVEDRYNLAELKVSGLPTDHTQFELEDFRHVSINSGTEPNKIAQKMNKIESNWVLVDFGLHDQTTCTDFISELARYNYTNPRLRNRGLIFIVSAVSINIFARAVNECFNNLPASSTPLNDTRKTSTLLLITHIELILIRMPLLAGTLRLIHNSVVRFYRRVVRAT